MGVRLIYKDSDTARLRGNNYQATVDAGDNTLHVSVSEAEIMDYRLLPLISHLAPSGSIFSPPGKIETMTVAEHSQGFLVKLGVSCTGSDWETAELILEFGEEYLTFGAEYVAGSGALRLDDIFYGSSMDEGGLILPSAGRFEEIFLLEPDHYQAMVPAAHAIDVKLGSRGCKYKYHYARDGSYDRNERYLKQDGGRFLFPPYVVGVRAGGNWFSVGTLEMPWAEFGLRVKITQSSISCLFNIYGSLSVEPGETYRPPKMGFFFASGKEEVFASYIDYLFRHGLVRPKTRWHDWWSKPIFCFFADQIYEQQVKSMDPAAIKTENSTSYMNERFLNELLGCFAEHDIPYGTVIIDVGWFTKMGDWRAFDGQRFTNMRQVIDSLHAAGKKVALWYSPYFVDPSSDFAHEYRDCLVKHPETGEPATQYLGWLDMHACTPDYTHPKVRAFAADLMRYLLSPGPCCLDADGLKFDCPDFYPEPGLGYHDSSWGIGEIYQYKVMKLIYDSARAVKDDVMIETTGANPFYNDVQDLVRLNDLEAFNADLYDQRVWVTNLCRCGMIDTDDWLAMKNYVVGSQLKKIIYGVPAIYAIKYRCAGRGGDIQGGYACSVTEEEYRLLSSLYHAYLNAPVHPSQVFRIDYVNKVFWRKHSDGKLAGFYAAVGLSGNQAVATYSENKAMIVSTVEGPLLAPLAPAFGEVELFEVHRNGKRLKIPAQRFDENLAFIAKRCDGTISHYEFTLI